MARMQSSGTIDGEYSLWPAVKCLGLTMGKSGEYLTTYLGNKL